MSAVLHARGRLVRLLVALMATLVVAPLAHADTTGKAVPPQNYYLALGDSLAYGYQQAKFNAEFGATHTIDPSTFNTGYADDFLAAINGAFPDKGTQLINDGCPGETSDSMINANPAGTCAHGGFPQVWLHHPYADGGPQLADAVAFLNAHPKKVTPITINIGANDLLATNRACASHFGDGTVFTTIYPGALACVAGEAPHTIGHIAQNLGVMLTALRDAAPKAEIIVLGLYNPNFIQPGADALIEYGYNPTMAGVAAQFGAFFADPFPAINVGIGSPAEFGSVCSQIAICTALQDIHPFDNGYQAIANVLFDASGLGSLN
jgi:lysophospholipase L1-like esterase